MKSRDVGLQFGEIPRIARRHRVTRAYVWQIAVGMVRGRESIRRSLTESGWTGPPATSKYHSPPDEKRAAARALATLLTAADGGDAV